MKEPSDPLESCRLRYPIGVRKTPISMRLDPWLLDLLKLKAKELGLPYQQLIAKFIEQGLRRTLGEGKNA